MFKEQSFAFDLRRTFRMRTENRAAGLLWTTNYTLISAWVQQLPEILLLGVQHVYTYFDI